MEDLTTQNCVPCEGNVPPLTSDKIKLFHKQVKNWKVIDDHHLEREYKFKDFKTALEFVNKVGEVAEHEGHHPDIYFTWGKAKINIFTHAIDGLSTSDFILAAKIDKAGK